MTYNYGKWTYFQEGGSWIGVSSSRTETGGGILWTQSWNLGCNGTTYMASNVTCFPGDSQDWPKHIVTKFCTHLYILFYIVYCVRFVVINVLKGLFVVKWDCVNYAQREIWLRLAYVVVFPRTGFWTRWRKQRKTCIKLCPIRLSTCISAAATGRIWTKFCTKKICRGSPSFIKIGHQISGTLRQGLSVLQIVGRHRRSATFQRTPHCFLSVVTLSLFITLSTETPTSTVQRECVVAFPRLQWINGVNHNVTLYPYVHWLPCL